MEGIVFGIAQINFHQNLSEISSKNSSPNFPKTYSSAMSVSQNGIHSAEEVANVASHEDNSSLNNLSAVETVSESGWEEVDNELESAKQYKKCYTLAERRHMPTRASKESSLLGIKRRTIMKPTKRLKKSEDFQNLKPSEIKKIYLNKKVSNFRPSSLETIFEETSSIHNNEQECIRLMGGRKIKRSLSFSDGFKYDKTIVNKRRAKIRKTFGKRFALKKISLEDFISRLNSSIENIDEVRNRDCEMENDKGESKQEISIPKIVSNISETEDDSKNLGLPNAFKNTMSFC